MLIESVGLKSRKLKCFEGTRRGVAVCVLPYAFRIVLARSDLDYVKVINILYVDYCMNYYVCVAMG